MNDKSTKPVLSIAAIVTMATVAVGSIGSIGYGAKPDGQKFPDASATLADEAGHGIKSDGLGEYVDSGTATAVMNPNGGAIVIGTGRIREFSFDLSQVVSEEYDSPFGTSLIGRANDSAIYVLYAGMNMEPGESKSVGIQIRIESGDGRKWYLHLNSRRSFSEPYQSDPNPPTVTAYDLDGSGDGISDTWVTSATAETTPAVLYELVKIKGEEIKIERGRFIVPFTLTLVLDR